MDIRRILSTQKNFDIEANLPDGMFMVGYNGLIQWVNDVAHDLFHVEEGMLFAKNINDVLENGFDLIKNSSNTHKALIAKNTQGEEYFEITAREIEEGYIVALRDSTKNYKRISGILEEQKVSQKINNDKNCFLVKLANEFNAPMQSIIGFSQGLLDGLGGNITEKQAKYVNIIKKNSTDLLYFFNKLVELSQSEGNLFEGEEKYFDIVSTIDGAIKTIKSIYGEKPVDIDFNYTSDIKRTMVQNENIFKIMVNNLIEALIREIDLGKIYVTLSDASDEFLTARNIPVAKSLLITVSSVNMVVLESELATLFNPYAIVDSSSKRTISRALTLGIVANIAKEMGGVVWAEISPMKDLVFNLVIPREKAKDE